MTTIWNANSCMTWYILEPEIRRERKKRKKENSSFVAVAVKLKENTLINPREFLGSCKWETVALKLSDLYPLLGLGQRPWTEKEKKEGGTL